MVRIVRVRVFFGGFGIFGFESFFAESLGIRVGFF